MGTFIGNKRKIRPKDLCSVQSPVPFNPSIILLKGFLKKGCKLLIIDGHIWCWWLSAVSEGQLYIHERATHLNFYWYLMTDLKVVTVYSSSLESRHRSPHNMNFFSF